MKLNKIKIAALGLLTMSAFSCSESFLDVESKTEGSTDNFYKTESDAYRALIGCYDGWQCTVSNGPTFTFQYASMLMSDECFGGTGNSDGRNTQVIDRFDQSQESSATDMFNDLWKYYYQAIYRCNELITRMGEDTTSAVKSYVSQAKAIRAFCYFDMARLWGNVPLITEPTKENVPQSDPKDVFAQIVKDLNDAIDGIDASKDSNYKEGETDAAAYTGNANDGWITKYAVEAMLARVYLFYSGYYGSDPEGCDKAKALAAVNDVINSGKFGLVPEFKNLWPAAAAIAPETVDENTNWSPYEHTTYVRGNQETVLAMKFNYTADYNGNNDGNRAIVMLSIRGIGGGPKYPYGQGWGGCTVNPKMLTVYESGDTRKEASIIDLAGEGIADMDAYKDVLPDQREYTGYVNKKYTALSEYKKGVLQSAIQDLMAGDWQISQPQDYVLIRYADVLLMQSELAGTADGLNEVRKRAGLAATSYSEENIRKERLAEFAFEGIRYWDLLRYGIDYAASQLAENTTVQSGGVDENYVIDKANFTAKKGLMQIPNEQITLSNYVLKQNAGW